MKTVKFINEEGHETTIRTDFIPKVGERIEFKRETYDVIQYTTDYDKEIIIIEIEKLIEING